MITVNYTRNDSNSYSMDMEISDPELPLFLKGLVLMPDIVEIKILPYIE